MEQTKMNDIDSLDNLCISVIMEVSTNMFNT